MKLLKSRDFQIVGNFFPGMEREGMELGPHIDRLKSLEYLPFLTYTCLRIVHNLQDITVWGEEGEGGGHGQLGSRMTF